MARERGYLRALIGPLLWVPGVVVVVMAGIIIGLVLIIGGIIYDSVIWIILGVIVWIIWVVLLWAISVLFDDAVNWLDEKFPETPEVDGKEYSWDPDTGRPTSRGKAYTNPYPAPPPRAPMRPEPGTCADCGGKLFLGRENCPHCGAKVHGPS